MAKRKDHRSRSESPDTPIDMHYDALSARYTAPASVRQKFDWRTFGILIAIVTGVVTVCYANTIWMSMAFNDPSTFAGLRLTDPQSFFSRCWAQGLVQPLAQPWLKASFATDLIDYHNSFGWYHLVNVFLHLSASIALACLVMRCCWRQASDRGDKFNPYMIAGVSSVLFACHPLAVQSATYISSRYAPLAVCNILIAVNLFIVGFLARSGAARWWGYGLSILFSVMALNSSEVAIALPSVMLACCWVFKPNDTEWMVWVRQRANIFGIMIVLSIAAPLLYFTGFIPGYASDSYGLPTLNTAAYTATQFKAFLTYYTRCFFVPLGISLDPPFSRAVGWSDAVSWLGGALVIALAWAVYRYRQYPLLCLGIVLVLAGFFPHACIVQPESVADPIFYLSLAGMSVVSAWVANELCRGLRQDSMLKVAPVICVLVALTIVRNIDWSSDDKLFAATVRTNENSAPALAWSAMAQLTKRDYAKALSFADQALVNDPNLALACMVKGEALDGLDRSDEAEAPLVKAEKIASKQKLPIAADAKLALAENYIRLGKPEPVTQLALGSIALNPTNPRAVLVIGLAAYEHENYDQAYTYLHQAAEYGVIDALPPLVDCSIRAGKNEEALAIAREAAKQLKSAAADFAMGSALYADANLQQSAEGSFKAVLKRQPKNAGAMAYLSLIYDHKGDKVLADSYRADALKLDPHAFSHLPLAADSANVEEAKEVAKQLEPTSQQKSDGKKQDKQLSSSSNTGGTRSHHSRRRR